MMTTPMREFTVAQAAGQDWARLAKSCADQLLDAGAAAPLGLLYATDALADDLGSVLTFLRERTGINDWIGTVGLGICATGHEYFDEPALAVMAANLPAGSYRVLPVSGAAAPPAVAAANGMTPGLAIVHGDPRETGILNMVSTLAEDSGCYLVGGLSSSRGLFAQVADGVAEGGLSGLVLSAEVPVVVGLTQGCAPAGPVRTVSEGGDNIVATIDDRPAFDVLLDDLGLTGNVDRRDEAGLQRALADIHVAVPIAGSDTGDYVVRSLVGAGPDRGWIAVGGTLSAGHQIMFCRRDAGSAEQDLRRMLEDVARRADGSAQGGVYFSCVGRGPSLFGDGSRELGIIAETFGDTPIVGFFGNGEICRDRLYGFTGVLALFT